MVRKSNTLGVRFLFPAVSLQVVQLSMPAVYSYCA
uniref:Uncharacterized protein n=1 Tax=Anguilla anguilla TaxID=7936 RepID=A0A0E9QHA0_ANGAN